MNLNGMWLRDGERWDSDKQTVQVPYRRVAGPLNLLIDSTGIKFLSDGEWQTRKHGPQGRRQWRKVHLAMDPATSDIRALELTPSRDGDSPVLPGLLGQIPKDEQIGTVTADGAYDTRRCHKAIIEREDAPIIPIRKKAACGKTIALRYAPETRHCARSDTTGRRSGNAGPDTTSAAVSRRVCAA
ncbi:Mobile element protein [Salipiger mucosus DSM 16094]|uniref:Mobile element protein n=1 Tax=Salipiger mucosus DSM 16094 TaxID=1123237 RepID=S9RXF3_9RHOB|nr:Mobile element protein [Salipiger mucosus DSM 16094]